MHLELTPRVVSGNDVLTVKDLAKAFPQQDLFSGVDFSIKRGERVAIIGANGTGKTTILKILNGLVEPDAGEIELGSKVQIGYYDQEHHVLHMEKTIFEEISDEYPYLTNTEIRNVLAAFLFTGMMYLTDQCTERWGTWSCIPGEADAFGSKLPDPRRADQPSGYRIEGNSGAGAQPLHRNGSVCIPRPLFY